MSGSIIINEGFVREFGTEPGTGPERLNNNWSRSMSFALPREASSDSPSLIVVSGPGQYDRIRSSFAIAMALTARQNIGQIICSAYIPW
jgi:hypothetical protein